MELYSVTLFYHRKSIPSKIFHYLVKDEKTAEELVEELRKPHYNHADEILKLYEQNEMNYLAQTIRFPMTWDFMHNGDLVECETEEEIAREIIRFEVFNYSIEKVYFSPGNLVLTSTEIPNMSC